TMLITVKGTLWGSTDVRVTKKELSQDIFLPFEYINQHSDYHRQHFDYLQSKFMSCDSHRRAVIRKPLRPFRG
ncbi:hypothetical protein, partial [Klebsiella pneumoniae]|uniref:hypothetical protein n=1 Tax=Klebsiella pneumoniae TaxID=573 RepID=UPI001F493DD8